jgi:hypothetical protein
MGSSDFNPFGPLIKHLAEKQFAADANTTQWPNEGMMCYHLLTMCHAYTGVRIKFAASECLLSYFLKHLSMWLQPELLKLLHLTKHFCYYSKTQMSRCFLISVHILRFYLITNNYNTWLKVALHRPILALRDSGLQLLLVYALITWPKF